MAWTMRMTAVKLPHSAMRMLLACLLVAAALLGAGASSTEAQTLVRRCSGLFDCMFTPHNNERRPPQGAVRPWEQPRGYRVAPSKPTERTRRAPQRSRSRATSSAPAVTPPPEPEVAKHDDARKVLVVGDFMAGGLAEGLEQAYASVPGVVIVERSNGSSGFVRDDYYDWNDEIDAIFDEVKPAAVIVMIGSNDRQQIKLEGARAEPRTPAWFKEYERRLGVFAGKVRAKDLPLIWTGMPAFRSPSMTSDMLAFNDLYRKAAEEAGGTFVDIWDGFVDEGGNFIFTGPDMNGQPVRLRGSDGINLTQAAKRKVAFYVEKPLNKLLGRAALSGTDAEGAGALPDSGGKAEGKDLDRTAPIALNDPDLDGGAILLGDAPLAKAEPEGERDSARLIVNGIVPEAKWGRADNFSLVKPQARKQAGTVEAGTGATPTP